MKFPKISALLTAITISTVPMAGAAQAAGQSPMCGLIDDKDQFSTLMYLFLGPWNASHLSGYVTMGPMMLPFPADNEVEVLNFEISGNNMVATHPEMQGPMVFKIPNEPIWRFVEHDTELGIPAPNLTSEDIELVMDCKIDQMPRLIGRATAVIDGVVMNFVWRALILDFENMYVIQHVEGVVQGTPFFSRRIVTLSRSTSWDYPDYPETPEDGMMEFSEDEAMDISGEEAEEMDFTEAEEMDFTEAEEMDFTEPEAEVEEMVFTND